MLLLEQETTSKKRLDKKVTKLKAGDGKKYEVKAICDSIIYVYKAEVHLLALYYLVAWQKYPKEENTWKLSCTV